MDWSPDPYWVSDCACADGCRQCRVRPTVNTVSIGNKGAFYAHIKASMASLRDVRATTTAIRPLSGHDQSYIENVMGFGISWQTFVLGPKLLLPMGCVKLYN